MRIPGAQREFAAFVAQRTALVAKIYSVSSASCLGRVNAY
jgi:hypothetical protein